MTSHQVTSVVASEDRTAAKRGADRSRAGGAGALIQ